MPAASHSGRSPSARASSAGRGPSPPSPGPGPATTRPCERLPPASPCPADGQLNGRMDRVLLTSFSDTQSEFTLRNLPDYHPDKAGEESVQTKRLKEPVMSLRD